MENKYNNMWESNYSWNLSLFCRPPPIKIGHGGMPRDDPIASSTWSGDTKGVNSAYIYFISVFVWEWWATLDICMTDSEDEEMMPKRNLQAYMTLA